MFLQFLGIKTTLFVSLYIFAIHPPIHTCNLKYEIFQISVACEKVNARFGNCTDYSEKTDPY